jgi:hypothetical protein
MGHLCNFSDWILKAMVVMWVMWVMAVKSVCRHCVLFDLLLVLDQNSLNLKFKSTTPLGELQAGIWYNY